MWTSLSLAEVTRPSSPIQSGDLIFFNLDIGPSTRAISHGTREALKSDLDISHLAVLEVDRNGTLYLIEAAASVGVRRISWNDYFLESGHLIRQYWLGRWKEPWRLAALDAQREALDLVGSLHDPSFDWESSSYYCAKLMKLFRDRDSGEYLVPPKPMTFGVEGSESRNFWIRYFKGLGLALPIGQLGLSPLGVYLASRKKYFY